MNFSRDISPEEFERIERFLNTEMSAEESMAFEAELEDNDKLLDKVAAVKLFFLGISEDSLEEKLDQYHSNLSEAIISPKKIASIFPINRRKLLVAASIIGIISLALGFWLNHRPPSENIYSNYYKPEPGLATVMSAVSNYYFQKAMVEYKDGQYEHALNSWNDQLKQHPANDTLIYFIGVAYQANKQHDLAISKLELISRDASSVFQKDACWYLGLIYLKKGKTNDAINLIQQSEHEGSSEIIQAINKK